ncbi:MAG: ATP-binding cassette domain-containing protein [Deltaproteobacteria bacterium]|nr:ATP-binding cassette domain-containing protein [Deltaproteobacteria bacterium]
MSLVAAINVSLTYSSRTLFKDLGFQVEPGNRIGLVGPNGSGKTTLLRLLTGEISPHAGEIRVTEGTRVGYLRQDIHETLTGTTLQSVVDSIPGRVQLRKEIHRIEEALKETTLGDARQEKLAVRLADVHEQIADLDRHYPSHGAEKILSGLGFKPDDFETPVSSLSGGWKMRAALASLLYQNPDLLLLDEPTNHLDIPSVRWFDQFLQDYRGAMVLVCHDREFLNRQINRVISFEPEGMRSYSGNYDFYIKVREEERKILEAKAKNQELKVKEARKFIDRFQAKATKARQAQSKLKLLKKMELVQSHRKEKAIRFSFPKVSRSGRVAVNMDGLSKSFDQNTLYKDLELTVLRGERIAIIGPNGAGKTTLLRMLAGEVHPDAGRIFLGHEVIMSYYAQHHSEMLDPRKTIIEEVYQVVPHESIGFIRGICGAFLFSGEDVDKPIGVLSGGEKARVCLAKILVRPGNLLVMDEPTNHLDIISSEILIDALADYQGTLLFVSHNQSFVNRLATKIWDIEDGHVTLFPGRLDEYYEHLAAPDTQSTPLEHQTTAEVNKPHESPVNTPKSRKELRREKAEKRRIMNAIIRPIQEELSGLEKRISELEKRGKELEKILAEPDMIRDKERYLPLLNEYTAGRNELKALMEVWEAKQEELVSAEKKFQEIRVE